MDSGFYVTWEDGLLFLGFMVIVVIITFVIADDHRRRW